MSTLTRREYRGPFADMVDWLEAPLAMLRPATTHVMRLEDYVKDGSYVIRAELPGMDPAKDVDITVSGGVLTIRAERHEDEIGKHHSEFHYGTFSRSVTLPAGADKEHIDAVYGHGILEVTVPVADTSATESARKIPIRQHQHIKPT
jgi:HSP20 family protein